jgi:hypothetical protein
VGVAVFVGVGVAVTVTVGVITSGTTMRPAQSGRPAM